MNARPQDTPDRFRTAIGVFLTHFSPVALFLALLGSITARLLSGPVEAIELIIPLVVLGFWPLQEWLIHTFILHARPREVLGFVLDFPDARKHRAHHRDPWRTA